MKNFKYISLILFSLILFACKTEKDQQIVELKNQAHIMNPKNKIEFENVIKKFTKTVDNIDTKSPVTVTHNPRDGHTLICCSKWMPGCWVSIFESVEDNVANCSKGRIAVCGTYGDSKKIQPYCVLHDSETGKYYRDLSETPHDSCNDGKKVECPTAE